MLVGKISTEIEGRFWAFNGWFDSKEVDLNSVIFNYLTNTIKSLVI